LEISAIEFKVISQGIAGGIQNRAFMGGVNMKKYLLIFFLIILFGMTNWAFSQPLEIESQKKCPLCSMYAARYPKFNCQIVFKDGSYEAFDSTIGLLVYLHFPDKTGIELKPIAGIYFKDYLKAGWLESDKSFFVTGSDIRGPMGIQFLPVDSEQAANNLKKQAHGKDIVHFKMINREYLINAAEAGQLHKMAKKLILK
jgi:nitrous oxide reductase accessory protein NosL